MTNTKAVEYVKNQLSNHITSIPIEKTQLSRYYIRKFNGKEKKVSVSPEFIGFKEPIQTYGTKIKYFIIGIDSSQGGLRILVEISKGEIQVDVKIQLSGFIKKNS